MRRSIPFLIASLALAPLSLTAAPRAHADDAPDDQSPAAKAYRDAWWAETGGGNLTQAVEGYAKAADAEGPASVKARALYRRAVVLQRIGKTEEAIRTLERLAKDHPGEAALQTDARARLAEWTAVDLKTSFAEWYQRYQYSPEFQAKIVDLVLKLGSFDQTVGVSASQEILTIGAPAVPALRQHVSSSNYTLRERVVTALLQLGDVPSIEALRETTGWRSQQACWAALRSANEHERARLKAEGKSDVPFDQGLLAMLDGPVALLTWAATPAAKDVSESFLSFAFGWDGKLPEPAVLRPLFLARVENRGLSKSARSQFWYWLLTAKGVDVALAEAWARGEDPTLREFGLSSLANPTTPQGGSADAPAALRRLLKVAPRWETGDQQALLVGAVLASLDATPVGDELDRLADELLAAGKWHNLRFPLSAAARVVLARMVDRSRDPQAAVLLMQIWQRPGGGAEGDVDRLSGWARIGSFEDVRRFAAQALVNLPGDGPRRALALLGEPGLSPDGRFTVFETLLRGASKALLSEPVSRRALLTLLRAQEQADPDRTRSYVGRFLEWASSSGSDAQRATALDWVSDPVAFPRNLLRSDLIGWNIQPYVANAWYAALATVWPAWRQAWTGWTPVQRDAAVEGVAGLDARTASKDPEWVPFLRACARDASNGISTASRETILRQLDELTLDDLRAVYDLSTPKGADDAILVTFRKGARSTPELTPELFEALKLGLRPDGSDAVARGVRKAFQGDPRVQRPLIEALLAHKDDGVQESAVDILALRESSEDLPFWLKALALPSADVRAKAAAGLGRIAHPDATKALVAALDDPNSRVRDAAIASLEAIQKVEDLKKTWREKVR